MNTFITEWADGLLRWSWQATLLLGVAWLIVRRGRNSKPAFRNQVWLLTMIAIAILPFLTTFATLVPVRQPSIEPLAYVVDLPKAIAIASSSPIATEASVEAPTWRFGSVRTFLFLVWSAGFVWSLLRLGASWWRMCGIRRRAQQTYLEAFPNIPVDLSQDIASPVLSGFWNPRILLPADIANWANDDEQRGIILHEVAHRERRDHQAILLQRFLDAVFFFHPAVRYASRQLSMERELACDADVLRAGADYAAYADVILKVAERGVHERYGMQPAFNSSRKILERRIEMILSAQHSWIPKSWHRRALTVAVFAITAFIGVLIPRIEVTAWTAPPRFEPSSQPAAPIFTQPTRTAQVAQPRVPQPEPQQNASTTPPASGLGTITGTVIDASGAVVPGVRVTVTGPNDLPSPASETSAVSGLTGAFAFRDLRPGRYRLDASLPGFAPFTLPLELRANMTLRPVVTLTLRWVEMMLEVSAQRPTQVITPPVPATPAVPPPPIRVGGDIAAPALIKQTIPVYPAASRAAGVEGTVLIAATIDRAGQVINPKVVSRVDESLVVAALEAVNQWRYKPAMLNGQPVEIVTTITVSFSLAD